jgi:hypothetical protein
MISKGLSDVNTVRRRITPEVAASMMATNVGNRPISRQHVGRLAASMIRGEWDLNGATIKVASTGRLLDGQHRLSACVQSGCAFESLVVYGLPEESFATIDQGSRGRKISDVLAIETGANMKNVSAALVVLYQFRLLHEIPPSSASSTEGFSVAVAREMLNKHTGVIDSVAVSNSIPIWRNAQCAAVHYLFGMVDSDLAMDFAQVMREGSSDLRRPFNVFREGIIRLRRSSASPNRREASARAIKAFNAERTGKKLGILTWRSNEDFPRIDGLDYDSV